MLTLAKVIWGARCGKSARRVLLGETRARGYAHSVRRRRESAYDRKAPHGLPSSRLVSTNLFDLWVEAWRKKIAKGDVIVVRCADDLVLGFQYRTEAERFLREFRERLAKFGLRTRHD
jgi:RNA-directed DNA polymerase